MIGPSHRKPVESGWCPCGCRRWVDRKFRPDLVYYSKQCAQRVNHERARQRKAILDRAGGDPFLAGL